ncbi:MAG: helix-turn-helix domain-containing protein [Okeania sp. SIO2D1]|nr:helix-turn-helix domain-containing protein [Okeania sp. SIO2D1]
MVNFTAIKNIKNSLFLLQFNKRFHQEKELSFEEKQNQILVDIGYKLKRFREKHSICLERVAIVTMIRINLLEAIEEGNLEKLPEPVYIQGLIKRYADAMGLNGEQLANLFPTEKTQETSKQSLLNLSMPQLRPHHLYLLYVSIVLLSVSLLPRLMSSYYILGKKSEINNYRKEKNQSDLAQASSGNIKIEEKSTDQITKAKLEKQNKKQSLAVSVIVKEDSWVSIEIDGKIAFEGTLVQGTQKTWEAQEQLVFFAGNAGGILIPINNGQTMQLGKTGEVKEVVFTPTDTKISQSSNTKN